MKNKVKLLRTRKGLSQRALADLAKTSQQQIQRIETGASATRLEMAIRIAEALEEPMDHVFPGFAKAYDRARLTLSRGGASLADGELEELEVQGVDADPFAWSIHFRLDGVSEIQAFPITPRSKRRLVAALNRDDVSERELQFAVLDTGEEHLCINLAEIAWIQIRSDPATHVVRPRSNVEEDECVSVLSVGRAIADRFEIESDDVNDDEPGQLNGFINDLEGVVEVGDRLSLQDVNGEPIWFKAASIAMVRIPNVLLCPPEYEDEN